MCVWQAASEIAGEKERGKMKGAERLGGSRESKCGREQTEKKPKEKKRRRRRETAGAVLF